MSALFTNPFNHLSAHHRPVGTGASFGTTTHALYTAIQVNGNPNLNGGQDFAGGFTVVVENSTTDSLVTVDWTGSGSGIGLPVTLRMPTITQATSTDTDNPVCIFNTVSSGDGNVYEFYAFIWNGGSPLANICRVVNPEERGHPSSTNTDKVGISASGDSILLGLVRGTELASTQPISHLIHVTLDNQAGGSQQLSTSTVWPAYYVDGYCTSTSNCRGDISYGQLFAIPSSINSSTLGLSAMGTVLFNQLRDYGLRPIDGAGNNAHCRGDQAVTSGQRTEFSNEMGIIWPFLRPVLNSTENETASGGGTPIATNSAFDATSTGSSSTGGAATSPVYVNSGSGSSAVGDVAPTPGWPSPITVGSMALMSLTQRGALTRQYIAPDGWAFLGSANNFSSAQALNQHSILVYGTSTVPTPLTSTLSGTVTCTFTGTATGGFNSAIIHQFSGTSTLWHLESVNFESTNSSTIFTDVGVTTLGSNRLAINLIDRHLTIPSTDWITPSNMTGGTWVTNSIYPQTTSVNPMLILMTADMSSSGTIDGGSIEGASSPYLNWGLAIWSEPLVSTSKKYWILR